jgi:hypothetical protein
MMLPHREALYGGRPRSGKILAEDGVILTPFGFKKNTDLRVGDRVNNPDGSTAEIILLHPWQTQERWRVHFHDGTFTDVAREHLWLAWRTGRAQKKPGKSHAWSNESAQVVTTEKLSCWLSAALREQAAGLRKIHWPCIPVCEEQVFNVTLRYQSELDPYLLGTFLGDGSYCASGAVTITSGDIAHTTAALAGLDYTLHDGKDFCFKGASVKWWRKQLSSLRLAGKKAASKFIPREFLMGSVEVRWGILQGLMDTDGTVDSQGNPSFTSISRQLAEDVRFLVNSLGGTASIGEKEPFYRDKAGGKVICNTAYTLYIKHREPWKLFRMERKQARCTKIPKVMNRRVVLIEKKGTLRGRCLTVSHPNGLYITNDFIVTHNSEILLADALRYVDVPNYSAIIFRLSLTDLEGSEGLLTRAHEWLDPWPEVRYQARTHSFHWPNGASLSFGYMGSWSAWMHYQGNAYQYIGWDELTQHSERYYEEMFSRNSRRICPYHGARVVDGAASPLPDDMENCQTCFDSAGLSRVPLRVRGTTNPGGPGHEWVRKRFSLYKDLDKTDPVSDEQGIWLSKNPNRPFLPASWRDNPHIDQTAYAKSLEEIADPERRAQLIGGDWDRIADGRFKPAWFQKRYRYSAGYYAILTPSAQTPVTTKPTTKKHGQAAAPSSTTTPTVAHAFHEHHIRKFTVIDVACSVREGVAGASFHEDRGRILPASWSVIGTFGITPKNELLILEIERFQEESPYLMTAIKRACIKWLPLFVAVECNGPGKPIAQFACQMGVPVRELMQYNDKIANSIEAQIRAQAGLIYLPEHALWTEDFLGELTCWSGHPHEPNDQVDVLSNACHHFTQLAGNMDRDGTIFLHSQDLPHVCGENLHKTMMQEEPYMGYYHQV